MSETKFMSIGAKHYLLTKLRELARKPVNLNSSMYPYYDGFQELTAELVELGFAHIAESMDDEWSFITREGYLALRSEFNFIPDEITRLDIMFPDKEHSA